MVSTPAFILGKRRESITAMIPNGRVSKINYKKSMQRKETWFKREWRYKTAVLLIVVWSLSLQSDLAAGEYKTAIVLGIFEKGTTRKLMLTSELNPLVGSARRNSIHSPRAKWGKGNTSSRGINPHDSNCSEGVCEDVIKSPSWCSENGRAVSVVFQQGRQKKMRLWD